MASGEGDGGAEARWSVRRSVSDGDRRQGGVWHAGIVEWPSTVDSVRQGAMPMPMTTPTRICTCTRTMKEGPEPVGELLVHADPGMKHEWGSNVVSHPVHVERRGDRAARFYCPRARNEMTNNVISQARGGESRTVS